MTPAETEALRAEVRAAVFAEMERVGPEGFSAGRVARGFAGRAGRSTLYRWIGEVVDSGQAGRHLAGEVKRAAEERAAEPDPPAAAGRAAGASLPVVVRPEDVAGTGLIPVMELIQECVRNAKEAIQHARAPDGKIRNAKLFLAASEHMRRNLETATRIADSIHQISDVEQFHRAVIGLIEDVSRDYPEIGEILVQRLGQLATRMGA